MVLVLQLFLTGILHGKKLTDTATDFNDRLDHTMDVEASKPFSRRILDNNGGTTILLFKFAKFISCLTLLLTSLYITVMRWGTTGHSHSILHVALSVTYVSASLSFLNISHNYHPARDTSRY